MPDYKEMYLTMVRASEEAVNCLVAAQRKCEDLYLYSPEPEITLLEAKPREDAKTDGRTAVLFPHS